MAYQPNQGYQGTGFNNPGYNQYPPYPQQNQGGQNYGTDQNIEGGVPKREMSFTDVTVRAAFVRKVFFLVSIMLGVVALMTAIPFLHPETRMYVQHNGAPFYWLSYIAFLVVYLVLMCCEGVRRSFPANIICLGILTLSIGYMTMMITAFHNTEIVLLALVITTISCSVIIIFSMQTKYDITNMLGVLCLFSLFLMVFGIVAIITAALFRVRFMMMLYSGGAALLFMGYLAVDIQMIMGGKKYEISPEEHIFASINLFLDIVYIFWMILMLLSDRN